MSLTKTALIMAGGRGERFWPRSRKNLPKQFLSFYDDDKTLIQRTVDRIIPLIRPEDIFVATGEEYTHLVKEQLPMIPEGNILVEPVGRNTAPCIGLAATHIFNRYGEALMYIFPSDHLVQYESIFREALSDAAEVAEEGDHIVTIGIIPQYPETEYGYIRFNPAQRKGRAFKAEEFVEKPDLRAAKEYLSSRQYLWNSGIYIWKTSAILRAMECYQPELAAGMDRIGRSIGTPDYYDVLRKEFSAFPNVSIDYGVMEKLSNLYCVVGDYGWDDLGSWQSVSRVQVPDEKGNVVTGNIVLIDTNQCIIRGGKRLIAAVGVKDMVIVDEDDALLICSKENTGKIRRVQEQLRARDMEKYL